MNPKSVNPWLYHLFHVILYLLLHDIKPKTFSLMESALKDINPPPSPRIENHISSAWYKRSLFEYMLV